MAKYEKDRIVTGCVTGIENYGVFVGLDEYYSGLIHISEISDNFVRNINDYVNIGETIRVKILAIDEDNHHLKLSIKNIDYRMTKRRKVKIQETPSGFNTLRTCLNIWIVEKKATILNNKMMGEK